MNPLKILHLSSISVGQIEDFVQNFFDIITNFSYSMNK